MLPNRGAPRPDDYASDVADTRRRLEALLSVDSVVDDDDDRPADVELGTGAAAALARGSVELRTGAAAALSRGSAGDDADGAQTTANPLQR